ncbi:Retrotransposon gag protein [Gossypium australe]|uniref:Retrotransposon gag protein n=1 Tax=Gossypium australe TaxID=47621 RepID=A0A5B6UWN4_9ROSI|nr:Retrotransposon gag protein [Gossypium australe]
MAQRTLREYALPTLNAITQNTLQFKENMVEDSNQHMKQFLQLCDTFNQTIQLQREITNFKQYEGETLYEAWECFKTMLRKCLHYGLQAWLQIQIFYNGVDGHI